MKPKPNNRPPTGIQLSMLMGAYPFGGFYSEIRDMRFAAYGPVDPMGLSQSLCKLLDRWPTKKPYASNIVHVPGVGYIRRGPTARRVKEVNTRGWLIRRLAPKREGSKGRDNVFFYELTPSGREVLEDALRLEKGFPKDIQYNFRDHVYYEEHHKYPTRKVRCHFFTMRKKLLEMALKNPMPYPTVEQFDHPLIYADWIEDSPDGPRDSKLADTIRIVFARKK